jgi:hypothetical protein
MDFASDQRDKNYLIPVIITAGLYFFGAYFIGLIANMVFIASMIRARKAGTRVHFGGCLDVMFMFAMFPLMFLLIGGIMQTLGILHYGALEPLPISPFSQLR